MFSTPVWSPASLDECLPVIFPPQPRNTTLTGPLLIRAKYRSLFSFIPMVPKSKTDSSGDDGKN